LRESSRVKNALAGFLGTYSSRNTDYKGYWLFGFIVDRLSELHIDPLMQRRSLASTALDAAGDLARAKFLDQLLKNGITVDRVRQAALIVRRLPGKVERSIDDQVRAGVMVSFHIEAVMQDDRSYEKSCVVFVASHDAEVERRSARHG
jgi:hypothetical protein